MQKNIVYSRAKSSHPLHVFKDGPLGGRKIGVLRKAKLQHRLPCHAK